MGLATACLFLTCVVSYFAMNPIFGPIQYVPTALIDVINEAQAGLLSWLTVIKMGFLGGFWHANMSHLVGNFTFMLPALLVIEHKMGPLHLIAIYIFSSVFGMIAQYHMVGGLGIGSSCVDSAVWIPAILLMTRGFARLLVLPPLIMMLFEAAKWWLPDGVGHAAHIGGALMGMMYFFCWAKLGNTDKG